MQQEKQKEHGWDIDARLLMYADALRRGAALCANPIPSPSDPSGAPAARDPASGLGDNSGAPQRESGSDASGSTAASNPGSRGAPAAGSGGGCAACEAAPAEAGAACAASSGVAVAKAAELNGEGSAADQPGISKPAPGGSAPPAHACRPAGSSARAAARQVTAAAHSATAQPGTVAGPKVPWGCSDCPAAPVTAPAAALSALLPAAARGADSAGSPAVADAEPAAGEAVPLHPALTNGNAAVCNAPLVGKHTCLPAAEAVGKVGGVALAGSLAADDRVLEEAAALVADSAGPPTAPVPPTGKAVLLPAAVAAISASASLASDSAVIDKLARGAKAAAASLHGGAVAPSQPRALPKDACFAEVRANAPVAQRAACRLL